MQNSIEKEKELMDIKTKMSQSGRKSAYSQIKTTNKAKVRKAKANAKIEKIEQKNALNDLKNQARQLKAQGRRVGNAVERHFQQKADLKAKRNEVKMRELESRAKNSELDPELRKLEAATKSKVSIERARAAGKTAAYTSIGAAISNLGRGLTDEQNRDDAKRASALKDNLETIFGDKDSSSDDGQTTGASLEEGVV